MFRIVFILFLTSSLAAKFSAVLGQEKCLSRYSANIGIGAQKTGMPFRSLVDFPLHSSYHIGVERKWHPGECRRTFQSLDLILFNNTSSGSGYAVQTAFGLRVFLFTNVYFSSSAGIGIVHLFRPKNSFVLENGVYVPHHDRGKLLPASQLNLKIGYLHGRAGIIGSYQTGLLFNYNGDLQYVPVNFLSIGLMYVLGEGIHED